MNAPRKRDRGKWSSPTKAQRGSPGRIFCLPRKLHEVLDALRDDGASLSQIAVEALTAHPAVEAMRKKIEQSDDRA